MIQGGSTAAKRYLIVSNDWAQEVESAQKIVDDVYQVVTLADAKNGLLQSLRGKQAILWPSGTLQAQEFMREFSLELRRYRLAWRTQIARQFLSLRQYRHPDERRVKTLRQYALAVLVIEICKVHWYSTSILATRSINESSLVSAE